MVNGGWGDKKSLLNNLYWKVAGLFCALSLLTSYLLYSFSLIGHVYVKLSLAFAFLN